MVPVVGSRLGGIAELVTDGVNGRLVTAASVDEWSAVLTEISNSADIIANWRNKLPRPRTMADAAAEMAVLYRQLH